MTRGNTSLPRAHGMEEVVEAALILLNLAEIGETLTDLSVTASPGAPQMQKTHRSDGFNLSGASGRRPCRWLPDRAANRVPRSAPAARQATPFRRQEEPAKYRSPPH